LDGSQHQSQRHQPLLCTVVQVAFETTTRIVGRRDDSGARRHQFRARIGVRDRRRNVFSEIPQA